MEAVVEWAGPILIVLLSVWGLVKFIGTKHEKVGEAVSKIDPFVDQGVDVAEKVLDTDLDGDGKIADEEPSTDS